jgi:hypothetical protein
MRAGSGALYGSGLFVVNEATAPSLRVSPGPKESPWRANARGMDAHMVPGMANKACRVNPTVPADHYPAVAAPPGRRGL